MPMRKEKILRCYSAEDEKILLEFYPFKDITSDLYPGDFYDFENETLVVYITDYTRLLLKYLQPVFPLPDPTGGAVQEYFDVCWDNWMAADTWREIINNIEHDLWNENSPPANETAFYTEFINWLKSQLTWAALIAVNGNQ